MLFVRSSFAILRLSLPIFPSRGGTKIEEMPQIPFGFVSFRVFSTNCEEWLVSEAYHVMAGYVYR